MKPKTEELQPLEGTLLHTLLVQSDRLQALPVWSVGLSLVCNALLVLVAWRWGGADADTGGLMAAVCLLACIGDWLALSSLRSTGRSYGPDRPSVLALAAVRALLMIALGLLNTPLWLPVLVLLMITVVVIYSTWIEPFRLAVTVQPYTTPHFMRTSAPLRLLHIADIHVERITPRERDLNARIAQLKPDMIVFSGDFVNLSYTNDRQAEAAIREVIGAWQAPLGVYCVSGTPVVEPYERVRAFTDGLDNITLLHNQWVSVDTPGGPLHILGVSITHDMEMDRAMMAALMRTAPQGGLRLLLTHPPDIAPEANVAGIDLYMCGHTHGGQIRLPVVGALFSSSHLGNEFIMGRYELGHTTLYTSRGVGLEGLGAPRARFLCPPEIILWEINGSA